MSSEQLFASFLLDEQQGLEIALHADSVTEATPVQGRIMPLPGAVDFLEGIMHLREQTIPVINLKKRLNLQECTYRQDAKVAVVNLHGQQLGLMMDDIRDVFRADIDSITPVSAALQGDDRIISSLIHRQRGERVAELLDLKKLFRKGAEELETASLAGAENSGARKEVTISRFVVFSCSGQEYGVPVRFTQEITFLTEIDDTFKSGFVEGGLDLRGHTIPVLNASHLLNGGTDAAETGELSRVLVLANGECAFGLIVQEVREILNIPDPEILPLPAGQGDNLLGIYPRPAGQNVLLLNMENLVCGQIEDIKSMGRLKNDAGRDSGGQVAASSHHLITENCYLIFSIGKQFAIELKDVHEILENVQVMGVPGDTSFRRGVINLRGQVVPVIELSRFYGYKERGQDAGERRLIICSGEKQKVALEVDQVVTIYKQEKYHTTPSLNPQLAGKKDTLDRLIEFDGGDGLIEHVLVVNTYNLVRNHLAFDVDREEPEI